MMAGMMAGMMGGRGGMMGGMGGMDPDAQKKLVKLTRTDFLIQFLWKPAEPTPAPTTEEEQKAQIEKRVADAKEIFDKMKEAEKNNPVVTVPKDDEIEKLSSKKTADLENAINNALGGAGGAGGAGQAPAAGALPKGAPAPAPEAPKP
jgi:type IV pilus assembly protein PilM